MRAIITDIDYTNNYFLSILSGRKYAFYLTASVSEIFINHLSKGTIIDFNIGSHKKIVDRYTAYEVGNIEKIIEPNSHLVVFDLKVLKKDMAKIVAKNDYFLVLDLEMTLANYRQKKYRAEIIQAGYYLIDRFGNVILENGYYILPTAIDCLNQLTLRFLKINELNFYGKGREYSNFYDSLKNILEKYGPKIVVWGKNDIIALDDSYKINGVPPITNRNDFLDLLRLHRNYFGMKNDIGLFKAYQIYYSDLGSQLHDAFQDAWITKEILIAFLQELRGLDEN